MTDPILTKLEDDLKRFNLAVADAGKWYKVRIKELFRFREGVSSTSSLQTVDAAGEVTQFSSRIWELLYKEANQLMTAFAEIYPSLKASKKRSFEQDIVKVNEAFADLTESLIYESYKPDYKEFHKDTAKNLVVSALKKIDMLSILDDVEAIREIDPKYKLNKKLESGDEVLVYIEQYAEQVVEWGYAAAKFLEFIKSVKSQLTSQASGTRYAKGSHERRGIRVRLNLP